MQFPTVRELINPTLQAFHSLGGSASVREITETIIKDNDISDEVAAQLHRDGPETELQYRVGWARTELKHYGLVESSQRGIWVLTPKGREQKSVDAKNVRMNARGPYKPTQPQPVDPYIDGTPEDSSIDAWRGELLSVLQGMPPDAFERLCQRLLRESGFIEVEVTGRTGDGGIDGHGMIRLNGLVSFPVVFQCKRYTGFVTPSQVRDFRGAMAGRADKGLFITTGTFTRDATREAIREGVPPIDLIDGDLLLDTLKELGLGIETRWVKEVVRIETTFFKDI